MDSPVAIENGYKKCMSWRWGIPNLIPFLIPPNKKKFLRNYNSLLQEEDMASLSEEMEIEVLSRLPVKSLLRFQTICKPMYRLIRDPAFVKKHIEHAIQNGTSTFLMFQYFMPTRMEMNGFYSIDHTSLSSQLLSSIRGNPLRDSTEMAYPVVPPDYLKLLGSCYGLVCLRTTEPGNEDSICLGNPSTKEYKKLPDSPNHFSSSTEGIEIGLCGLGYDDKANDFKVIRVAEIDSRADCFDDSSNWSETEIRTIRPRSGHVEVSTRRSQSVFEIYSLRSNSWKGLKTTPYYFPGELKPGVMVNGFMHWWAINRIAGYEAIIYFDLSDEIFKEVAVLEGPMLHDGEVADSEYENNNVGVLGGCLCVLHKTFDRVDVWVMQEYGVKESWTKRFTTTEDSIIETSTLRVISDFQDGSILFSTDDSLVYYDPNRKRGTRKLRIPGTGRLKGAEKCIGSLVSLGSGTYC
ncbi:F-box protein CPR1-like [Papaver somniferum]|uniref:F-box protein CPR1-like n=1 Tax=Papaver somniferum TaxID=3469 RepID=UPI000E6FA461|nr:F-box protein CPR1-like [Papaver somniferum]